MHSLEPILREMAAVAGSGAVGRGAAAALPAGPGAYLLLLRLERDLALDIATLGRAGLQPGWYAYAGSARGPGGIRARVARHFRRDKLVHWHVDRLTGAAADLSAFAVPGGRECALVAALRARPGWETPLPGFGSSDCRACASHLLGLVV